MKHGYLDKGSIESKIKRDVIGNPQQVFVAWYTDQDGGEIGSAEFESYEEIPDTYEFYERDDL